MLGKRGRFETRALYGHRGVLSGDIPARQALPKVIEIGQGFIQHGTKLQQQSATPGTLAAGGE
jgi:hypothetical protein